jgi:NTP pyrophosphatase (non-canonical NTP hydrolase)
MSQSRREVINNLAKNIFNVVKLKGFHTHPLSEKEKIEIFPSYIANLHSEISELWEAYRNNKLFEDCNKADKMEALGLKRLNCLEEELSDEIIRCLDIAYEFQLDIGQAILDKLEYCKTREWKHGGKRV